MRDKIIGQDEVHRFTSEQCKLFTVLPYVFKKLSVCSHIMKTFHIDCWIDFAVHRVFIGRMETTRTNNFGFLKTSTDLSREKTPQPEFR